MIYSKGVNEGMDAIQALMSRRSIRRFTQEPLPREALERIGEAARLSPTGTNRQPLQLAIVTDAQVCHALFPCLRWAGRIPDGSAGPTEASQPTAYVLLLVDQRIAKHADNDAGAAAMSVMIAAEAQGIASCWLASVDRAKAMAALQLDPEILSLHSVIALGRPAMRSSVAPMKDGDTDYYLEGPDDLRVPKRAAEDVIRWYA